MPKRSLLTLVRLAPSKNSQQKMIVTMVAKRTAGASRSPSSDDIRSPANTKGHVDNVKRVHPFI